MITSIYINGCSPLSQNQASFIKPWLNTTPYSISFLCQWYKRSPLIWIIACLSAKIKHMFYGIWCACIWSLLLLQISAINRQYRMNMFLSSFDCFDWFRDTIDETQMAVGIPRKLSTLRVSLREHSFSITSSSISSSFHHVLIIRNQVYKTLIPNILVFVARTLPTFSWNWYNANPVAGVMPYCSREQCNLTRNICFQG